MSALPPPNYSDLELPSYDTTAAPNYTTPTTITRPKDSILGPATLFIAGRFIYSTDPQDPPLYEFSHDVSYLHDSDRNVKVERIDPVTKTSAGLPQVVLKNRHLFDLKHPTAAEFPSFPYHAEATSQRALTSFGVSCFRSGNILRQLKGFRFERMVRGPGRKFRADGVLRDDPGTSRCARYRVGDQDMVRVVKWKQVGDSSNDDKCGTRTEDVGSMITFDDTMN
ncbi:hypothetical protein HZS61_016510 [Fusarium oxysporum f. sp. conglutinans]|uniref:Uncharacterized protein n=1 Tax=Fusarium oxysporum f. sp. conglutinans TaxID=100902 RepID=A0A8H6GKP7_FUSOX|nr:hypothetical protein HZS61_016510 [Fusarium oxysporum f. sp. conglutinans]KAG6995032.1 hypothetical protein FocnCong_v016887 [Fusarium oxysporum f. sp. conglutinans]